MQVTGEGVHGVGESEVASELHSISASVKLYLYLCVIVLDEKWWTCALSALQFY